MQKNSAFNKAWLKVTYKDNTFLPVNVIQRTSQFRSLICDEGTTDRKFAYEVQHNLLIPRNIDKSESDLLKMQYANVPELKKYFTPHQITNENGSSKRQKYKYIGQNLIVDLKFATDNNGDNYQSVELEKFYKLHLHELLSNNQKKQQFTIIVSKDNINPHCYLDPLFQLLAKTPEFWPHAAKIQKLSLILKKLLFNVTLQLKLGFLQHKENSKQSRKVMFVHLKPFIPNWPSQSLVIPDQIIALGNSKKFSQMYKAPTPCPPETPGSQTQGLVDAFLSLGVQVKAIHSLMRFLSLIINLDRTQVQKQTQGKDSKYVTYHIKTTNSKRAQESLENIDKILEMGRQRLEQLMIFGEVQNAESSQLEKKKIAVFENLGTKKQVATYRTHTIKVLLYEIWIAHVCEILNKTLCSEQYVNNSVIENTEFQIKCFVVLSYGVAKKCNSGSLNQRSTQLNNVVFWNNARYVMESKLLDVTKSCITASIIGKDSQSNTEAGTSKDSQLKSPKKVGVLKQKNGDKGQQKLNRFKTMFNYQSSIKQVRNHLLDPTNNTLEFKEIDLLQKEELLYLLYEEISSYTIFPQIQKQIFGNILKRETVKQNPYSLYEYVWNSYEQNQNLRKFDKDIKCITNSQLLSENQQTLKQISEAIHIKQLKLQDEGNKQIIQLKLNQFSTRYLYADTLKKKVHRKYPKPLKQLSKNATKNQRIANSTAYQTHQKTSEQLAQKIQMYINKEQPDKMEIKLGRRKQDTLLLLKGSKKLQKLEEEKQIQYEKVRKIEKQYLIYKARKKTCEIIFKINRERKLEKKLADLHKMLRKRLGLEEIKNYVVLKYIKQLQERKRIQQLLNQQNYVNQRENYQPYHQMKKRQLQQAGYTQSPYNQPAGSTQPTGSTQTSPNQQINSLSLPSSTNTPSSTQPSNNNTTSNSLPTTQNQLTTLNNNPNYAISITPSPSNTKVPQETPNNILSSQLNPHFLHSQASNKKNQNQLIEKSQNLDQLSTDQLHSIKDSPSVSLEEWQKVSKIKFLQIKNPEKQMFTKYASLTQRLPSQKYEYTKPKPDEQILERFIQDDYMEYIKSVMGEDVNQSLALLHNQKQPLKNPLLKQYPIKQYPNFYKEAFNAIIKIGLQKNSSKPLNELLNVLGVPLSQSYYSQLAKSKMLFDQDQAIPSDYSSHHNVLKDQVFLYFAKQITHPSPQNVPDKNYQAYLFGLSVFTRYYCPSPKFLYPFTTYIFYLYKTSIEKKVKQYQVDLLQSIFENLLFFIQATEGFKRNTVKAFAPDKNKPVVNKNEAQCAGYLHPRKNPIRQTEINKPEQGKKPQPLTITIWLINNQSFILPVRNEIAKTIKKKVLGQIGYLNRQQCFSLYFFEPDYSYTFIDEKQRASNLLLLTQVYKDKNLRRPIYLRITHYFPFILKDINTTRLMYLNMISDQLTFPWLPQQYQFVVAQSMAYEDYEQIRIGNYLHFTNQQTSKSPNMKPVQEKFKAVVLEANKKICEYEYMKYVKGLGFFLAKCYHAQDDAKYVYMVKPHQIVIMRASKILSSIGMKRIKNVYIQKDKVVLELNYKNCLAGQQQQNQRLRTHTIENIQKMPQLFKSILFHLENRL